MGKCWLKYVEMDFMGFTQTGELYDIVEKQHFQ